MHICTRPSTYSLVVPALPLMATKAVEQLVSDKQVVSLGGAHYRTPLPWCCRTIHAFPHPHPWMLNPCQILHQFCTSHCTDTNTLLLYCFPVHGIFYVFEGYHCNLMVQLSNLHHSGNKLIAYQY